MQNCKYLNPISNVPFSNSISCTDEIGEIVLCDNVMTNYAAGQPWILRVIFQTSKSSRLFYTARFRYLEFSVAVFISLQFFQYLLLSPAEVWWLENSVRFWFDIKLAGRRLEAGDWMEVLGLGPRVISETIDQETRDQPQICRLSSFLLLGAARWWRWWWYRTWLNSNYSVFWHQTLPPPVIISSSGEYKN